jgi:hypothetical protein
MMKVHYRTQELNMHDPLTVAHEIKYPWRAYSRKDRQQEGLTPFDEEWRRTYRNSFITIWHKDPELHGSDDSCGWFTPPFSAETRDIVKSLASEEAREPWFMALSAETNPDPVASEALLFGAFMMVSRCLTNRGVLRKPVSVQDGVRWASEATHNSVDNFRSSLCFKSGYHSNTYDRNAERGVLNSIEEDRFWREEQAKAFFGSIAGWILRARRPWWKHPRWHLWHWRFQVHPLQLLKRWLFERCEACGKGFKYGETPTGEWSGNKVWHQGCSESAKPSATSKGVHHGK